MERDSYPQSTTLSSTSSDPQIFSLQYLSTKALLAEQRRLKAATFLSRAARLRTLLSPSHTLPFYTTRRRHSALMQDAALVWLSSLEA